MGSIAFLIISGNSGDILYIVLKGFIPKMVVQVNRWKQEESRVVGNQVVTEVSLSRKNVLESTWMYFSILETLQYL